MLRWMATVAMLVLGTCPAISFAQAEDYQPYKIETDTGVIVLPFKKSDFERTQTHYRQAVGAIRECASYQGEWNHLPADKSISVSVNPRKSSCRITIAMEDVRSFTCLMTQMQLESLSDAMSVYSEGDTLPNLYAPAIKEKLYGRSCDVSTLN